MLRRTYTGNNLYRVCQREYFMIQKRDLHFCTLTYMGSWKVRIRIYFYVQSKLWLTVKRCIIYTLERF